ncbi:MAG: hypothetical protein AAGF74_15300 [Pseudomonadota bacterium]
MLLKPAVRVARGFSAALRVVPKPASPFLVATPGDGSAFRRLSLLAIVAVASFQLCESMLGHGVSAFDTSALHDRSPARVAALPPQRDMPRAAAQDFMLGQWDPDNGSILGAVVFSAPTEIQAATVHPTPQPDA